ncbi:unnamed protein product, partial [Durusdinium trenchii]
MESTSFLRESYSFALYRWSSLTTRLLFLALDPTPTFLPSKRFGTPLQEAHCNFYLSELLACRTRGLARLQIGARSWDLASLEDGQHLILPSLSEREALMLSPQLRRMNHLKKITVGLKGPTIWWRTGTWELWSGPWWPGFFEKPARTRSGIVGQVAWR